MLSRPTRAAYRATTCRAAKACHPPPAIQSTNKPGEMMGPEDKRQRLWPRLGLAVVVAAAAGLALVWVFLVPIYQAPDEPQHLDYALAINTHRGLFQVHGKKYYDFPGVVHPYSVY